LILIAAAFGAGVLNTIAGGGTFLTFPALVLTGVPPVMANATSAVAVLPGYLGGALGFREELASFSRSQMLRLVVIILFGGVVGSGLLLVSSNEAFSVVVPFLLLAATLIFLFGDQLRAWAARNARSVTPEGAIGLFAVSVYGGYFNGGLGIVLLALFALWGMTDLNRMNGLKNGLSFALSAISVGVFADRGRLRWCATGAGIAEGRRSVADRWYRLWHERRFLLAAPDLIEALIAATTLHGPRVEGIIRA
jgi:uncharacterized membrane protein YfcA